MRKYKFLIMMTTARKKTSASFSDKHDSLLSARLIVAQLVVVYHLFVCLPPNVSAFVVLPSFCFGAKMAGTTTAIGSSEDGFSEVEQLLEMARKLRAEAEQQEQQVHAEFTEKKAKTNTRLDGLIDYIFSGYDVVEQLRKKKLSINTLELIVDRLDERHAAAMGQERIEATSLHCEGDPMGEGVVQYARVRDERDDNTAVYIGALIECLIESVSVLDNDMAKKKGGVSYLWSSMTHTESSHWGGGHGARDLRQRLQGKRRERDEQFLERQEEFYEAQRIYKKNPPNNNDLGWL